MIIVKEKHDLVYQDKSGRFTDLANLEKYYLACISYVPAEQRSILKRISNKSNLTSSERTISILEEKRQALQLVFEKLCNGEADNDYKLIAENYMDTYSLEMLVSRIIPREFDSLYTVFNNSSALEVKKIMKSLRQSADHSGKAQVMTAYLNYRLDDLRIRRSMHNNLFAKRNVKQKNI